MRYRDSKSWHWLMIIAVVTAISSRMDLIDPLLPAAHTDTAHAVIELIALVTGVVSGFLTASPLDLSDHGRRRYARDRVTMRPDGD